MPLTTNKPRTVIAALALSASGLVGIASWEHYQGQAYIPIKGDNPTIGWGETQNIKIGDKTTPDRALVRLLESATATQKAVQSCVHVPLYQYEFDAYVSLSYNIGTKAFCTSTLVKELNKGNYDEACKQILRWDRFKGKRLVGLAKRRESEYNQCKGA